MVNAERPALLAAFQVGGAECIDEVIDIPAESAAGGT